MNRYLNPGEILRPGNSKGFYKIKDIVGIDLSCVVYLTEYTDNNGKTSIHLLKEYNPDNIPLTRKPSGDLCTMDEIDKKNFIEGMKSFTERQKKHLVSSIDTKNFKSTVKAFSLFGTRYVAMPCINGLTYNNISENSLYELFKRARAIAVSVGFYHFRGLLHLDLRPENIFTPPDNPELVMIYDRDSVSSKNNILMRSVFSGNKGWKAPEICISSDNKKISEASDIFSIGEIIFYKLLSRHSLPEERNRFSVYDYEQDLPIFCDVNPKVFSHLSELFSKTLCSYPEGRYSSCDELIEKIDEILDLLNPDREYLMSKLPKAPLHFVGLENELKSFHENLNENNHLMLYGMCGSGKTSFALAYANTYRNCFDAVIYIRPSSNIDTSIKDDTEFPIYNVAPLPSEAPSDYLTRKKGMIEHLSDSRTLLIIDAESIENDKSLSWLLSLSCKIIIISEKKAACEDLALKEICTITEKNLLYDIFMHYYKKPVNEEMLIRLYEIFVKTKNHLHTAIILAKLASTSNRTLKALLTQFIDLIKGENSNCLYEHLLSLAELSDNEKYILFNLALMPDTGVSTDFFTEKLSLKNFHSVKSLITKGFIILDEENHRISLCNGIKAAILKNFSDKEEFSYSLLSEISKSIDNFDFSNLAKANTISLFLSKISETLLNAKPSTEQSAIILLSFGKFLYKTHDNLLALRCILYAIEILKSKGTSSVLTLAEALNIKGALNMRLEEYDSSAGSLFDAEKILRLSHANLPLLSEVYKNIGTLYIKENNLSDAEKYLYKALNIVKNLYGNISPKIADIESLIGTVNTKYGNLVLAKKHYFNAYNMRKTLYGSTHFLTAVSSLKIGEVLKSSGEYSRAISYLNKSYKTISSLSGDRHLKCADISFAKARILFAAGNKENAKIHFENVIKIYSVIYKKNTTKVSASLYALGQIYEEDYNYKKAKIFYERALEAETVLTSSTKDRMITYLNALGNLSRIMGLYEDAEKYYTQSLQIAEDVYGEKSKLAKKLSSELEYIHFRMGKPSELSEYTKKLYAIRRLVKKEACSKENSV